MAAMAAALSVALCIINVLCGLQSSGIIQLYKTTSDYPPLQDSHVFIGNTVDFTGNFYSFLPQNVLYGMYCNREPIQGKQKRYTSSYRTCKWNKYLLTISLLLCGDIEMNPGPPKKSCGECGITLRKNLKKFLQCKVCELTFHVKCSGVAEKDFLVVKNSQSWSCFKCTLTQFSDSFFDLETDVAQNADILHDDQNRQSLRKGLKVGLLNINRLLPHLDQLSTTVKSLGFNVVCVNETWLNNSINTGEINIEGYNVVRHDRDTQNSNKQSGGGVIIYIEDHIPYNVRPDLPNEKL